MMIIYVMHNLNSPQMRCCYIIELVYKVLSFRMNVWNGWTTSLLVDCSR